MSIDRIFHALSEPLRRVEKELEAHVGLIVANSGAGNGQNAYFDQVVRHIFLKPGKMLRPALVILSAQASLRLPIRRLPSDGDTPPGGAGHLIKLAAVTELIHSSSLIHDDILDDEELRREQVTLNRKYGNHVAVLTGDVLYSQAFTLLSEIRLPDREDHAALIRLFCVTAQRMCLGEIAAQRLAARGRAPGLEDYLEVLKNKTAVLMSACCRSGAVVAAADHRAAAALESFGLSFGMAFQLVDDHNDRDAPLALGARGMELASEYMADARESLRLLPESETRDSLEQVCAYVMNRARQPG